MGEMKALAANAAAFSGPDRDMNMSILLALGWYLRDFVAYTPEGNRATVIPDYLGSLDAACALVPEGHNWHLISEGSASMSDGEGMVFTAFDCATPAIALTVAALRARAAKDTHP